MTDKELFDSLSYKRKNAYEVMDEAELGRMNELCGEYKSFLDKGKTERECVIEAVRMAEQNGFVPLSSKETLKAGIRCMP